MKLVRQLAATAAAVMEPGHNGYQGEVLRDKFASNIETELETTLGLKREWGSGSWKMFIQKPDGSLVPPDYRTDTPIEKLRTDMFEDLYGSGGRYGRPADSVGAGAASRLLSIVDGDDKSQQELTPEMRQEIIDVLPSVVAYHEYKMYKWNYNTHTLSSALDLVEKLTAILPEATDDLHLQPMAKRLAIQATALALDVETGGYDRKRGAMDELTATKALLERILKLQDRQEQS
ncbi:MAG TPA: hypothetical protein VD947_01390 [Patescibacteria group bacterium]|nr:hypothetical protein [Patescibacteria group bacterium]